MQKKHIALLVVSVLIAVGLIGWGVWKYERRPSPPKTETTAQAIQGQKNAQATLAIHDAANQANIEYYQSLITIKATEVTQLCGVLTAHKLTNTICQ